MTLTDSPDAALIKAASQVTSVFARMIILERVSLSHTEEEMNVACANFSAAVADVANAPTASTLAGAKARAGALGVMRIAASGLELSDSPFEDIALRLIKDVEALT